MGIAQTSANLSSQEFCSALDEDGFGFIKPFPWHSYYWSLFPNMIIQLVPNRFDLNHFQKYSMFKSECLMWILIQRLHASLKLMPVTFETTGHVIFFALRINAARFHLLQVHQVHHLLCSSFLNRCIDFYSF